MTRHLESFVFIVAAIGVSFLLAFAPDLIAWPVQLAVLTAGVIFLGLPHGALDPAIAENVGLVTSKSSLLRFNLVYAGIVILVIALWALSPRWMLGLFLLISAWHFSGDWRAQLPRWAQLIGGAGLLLLPIVFHTAEVANIFESLSGPGGADLAYWLASVGWIGPISMLFVAAYAALKKKWLSAAELGALVPIGIFAPPLVFFIIYFCLLHSPRHLKEHFQSAEPEQHPKLWRMLVIYTLATLLLMVPLLWVWSQFSVSDIIIRTVFIGLAAVTVPHMMLMFYAESRTPVTQC